MALPAKQQTTYWGIATVVFLILLWSLGDVILPFVVGGAIAYCLDPIADMLERWGLSRAISTAIISLFAVLVFILAGLLIIPAMINQLLALVDAAPDIARQLQTFLSTQFPSLGEPDSTLRRSLDGLATTIQARGGELVNSLLASAMTVINAVVFIVVVPVVAFYLLLDWDNMTAKIDDLLPRDYQPTIRKIAKDVDSVLASFVRGQGTVCSILGVYYAVTLMIVGLQYGLVVGVTAGLISFIPYVGAVIGGVLAVGLAMFQFWNDPIWIAVVAGIFVSGQMLEGNVLTPKLVGGSVGLHPVWLLFALSAFGTVFGFVGMLVAVPVAAMIGVVARFFVTEYTQGRLYQGLAGQNKDEPEE